MGDFKNLHVWQTAMELVDSVYLASGQLPVSERFGLQSQMRRAAVSIPANIAEGTARGSDRELVRFLRIARGSAAELECLVLICQRRGHLLEAVASHLLALVATTSRLLIGMQRKLGG